MWIAASSALHEAPIKSALLPACLLAVSLALVVMAYKLTMPSKVLSSAG
jgi:hypothetical protein